MKTATSQTFQNDVLSASRQGPILVKFGASWCPPCQALKPLLEQIHDMPVVEVDVDQSPDLSQQYGVQGIPVLIVFRGGLPSTRTVGNPGSVARIRQALGI